MATVTLDIPDDVHQRMLNIANARNQSLDGWIKEVSTTAMSQWDAETRFRERAARGDRTVGLSLLDKLDQAFD